MHSFESIVDALWLSLKGRHDKRRIDPAGRRAIKAGYARPRAFQRRYGSLTLEKGEFREWLLAQSINRQGAIWTCAYSGLFLVRKGKTRADTMTIDHITPLDRGGTSELSNLQVISVIENKAKADLTDAEHRRHTAELNASTDGVPHYSPEAIKSIMKRLTAFHTYKPSKNASSKGSGW